MIAADTYNNVGGLIVACMFGFIAVLGLIAYAISRHQPKHRHHWEETSRVYHPSVRGTFEGHIRDEDYMSLSIGCTVIGLRCSDCGDVTARRLTGRVVPE